jgi:hypothetical protein
MTAGDKVVPDGTGEVETILGQIKYETFKVVDKSGKTLHSFSGATSKNERTMPFMDSSGRIDITGYLGEQ